jgi:uncharacterized protein YifE (UPF0438 family)
MSTHITPLITHCSAEQAAEIIDFLDIVREALWSTYGEQIEQMHRNHCANGNVDRDQGELDFNDDLTF